MYTMYWLHSDSGKAWSNALVCCRFKVRYLQSTKGDITVLVSTLKEEDSFEKLMELKNKEFG